MKKFFQVIFWTFWLLLCLIFNGVLFSSFDDKEMVEVCLVFLAIWWGITLIIALVKWNKYRKENPAVTKEQKNNIKQANKEIKYRNSTEYKQKYLSDVEIENEYFGKGILLKNSENPDNIWYTDIKDGFNKMFTSFGKESNTPYDLYEFLVKVDNINYVLDSLEKIYKNSKVIIEKSYEEIYEKIVDLFEKGGNSSLLKKEFSVEYVRENWNVLGVQIYDNTVNFFINIDAVKDHDVDSFYENVDFYEIEIIIDYATQKAEVILNDVM